MRAMAGQVSRQDAIAALRWYADMGVDEAIMEAPVDRFAVPAAKPERGPKPGARKQRDASAPAPARERHAATAEMPDLSRLGTLDDIAAALDAFEGCPLKKTATRLCYTDGSPDARVMFIGEGPGRDEDRQGRPFVGRAGQLLDKMLAAIELDRTKVLITNTVFWRPPGNREPTVQEKLACRPFLDRTIEVVAPDILVFLGGAAAKEMLETSEGITRLRGRWFEHQVAGQPRKCLATLHPAYLLRQPAQKKLAWRDLLMLRAAIDELPERAG